MQQMQYHTQQQRVTPQQQQQQQQSVAHRTIGNISNISQLNQRLMQNTASQLQVQLQQQQQAAALRQQATKQHTSPPPLVPTNGISR